MEEKDKIECNKLNIKSAVKIGNDIYLPLTGWLEEDKKYVVDKRFEKIKQNDKYKILTKIVLQPIDDAKLICQNWNETKCDDCDEWTICELNESQLENERLDQRIRV